MKYYLEEMTVVMTVVVVVAVVHSCILELIGPSFLKSDRFLSWIQNGSIQYHNGRKPQYPQDILH